MSIRLARFALAIAVLPLALDAQPAPASIHLTGFDGASHEIGRAELQALPALSVTLPGEHGTPMQMAGPKLWDVLQSAGAVERDFHKHVRQTITLTGTDGYSVVLALGEIDPEFEGKPAILATSRDGSPLAIPRLAIPGEKRMGRDVRDVAAIAVH